MWHQCFIASVKTTVIWQQVPCTFLLSACSWQLMSEICYLLEKRSPTICYMVNVMCFQVYLYEYRHCFKSVSCYFFKSWTTLAESIGSKYRVLKYTIQKFWVGKFFFMFLEKSLMLTKAAFIWRNSGKNSIMLKYYYNLNNFSILIYFKIYCNFYPVMQSWIFSSHYSSLQCHMILQIFWFGP